MNDSKSTSTGDDVVTSRLVVRGRWRRRSRETTRTTARATTRTTTRTTRTDRRRSPPSRYVRERTNRSIPRCDAMRTNDAVRVDDRPTDRPIDRRTDRSTPLSASLSSLGIRDRGVGREETRRRGRAHGGGIGARVETAIIHRQGAVGTKGGETETDRCVVERGAREGCDEGRYGRETRRGGDARGTDGRTRARRGRAPGLDGGKRAPFRKGARARGTVRGVRRRRVRG